MTSRGEYPATNECTAGVGVGLSVDVAVRVSARVGSGVAIAFGARVAFGVVLGVGAAVGSGDGESAWTRVAAGSPAAVGTAVATIAIVAVAPAVAIVADSGGVYYPPQENRTRMAGMAAAPLRPSPCRWACPTTISWRHSPHPTRWGSMTRPVYQPVVRFDSAGAGGWLCAVGAPVAKYIRPGEGLIHSPSGGGYLPLGSSFVAAGRQQLADGSALSHSYIRQPEDRLCESVRRAYPRVCGHCPLATSNVRRNVLSKHLPVSHRRGSG